MPQSLPEEISHLSYLQTWQSLTVPSWKKDTRREWQVLDCSCPTCSHILELRIKFLFSNQYASASLGRYYNSTCTFYAIKNTTFFSLLCRLLCLQYWCLWPIQLQFNLQIFSKHCTNNWKGAKESWEDCLNCSHGWTQFFKFSDMSNPNSFFSLGLSTERHLHLYIRI